MRRPWLGKDGTSDQVGCVCAAGVFPFRTHLTSSRLKCGYVEVTVEDACPLFSPGPPARGHVCHTAEILQVTPFASGSFSIHKR